MTEGTGEEETRVWQLLLGEPIPEPLSIWGVLVLRISKFPVMFNDRKKIHTGYKQ